SSDTQSAPINRCPTTTTWLAIFPPVRKSSCEAHKSFSRKRRRASFAMPAIMIESPRQSATGPQAALVRFAIRFKGIILALGCALFGYGWFALSNAKYDVFPEFAPPQVAIQTEAPGLSPE